MRGSVCAEARGTGRPPRSATSDEESVKRKTHGSARAKAPCDKGGGALKAGRPPGLRNQGHEREEFSEARGSAPAEPWPGWGRDLMKEKAKGGEPPDKPSKGWASARLDLKADLEAANQAVTWRPGLPGGGKEAACLQMSACVWRTSPHPHAQECVGHPRFFGPAASELASSAGAANEGCPERGPVGEPMFPLGSSVGARGPTGDG